MIFVNFHFTKQRIISMQNYDYFCFSLQNLKEIFNYDEPYANVILIGSVSLYKICFEQSWKAMKEILSINGVAESQTGSPRQILKSSYQVGLIKNEELWLNALVTRNNVAHAYNKEIALDIVNETKLVYYQMFCDLKSEMETNWL